MPILSAASAVSSPSKPGGGVRKTIIYKNISALFRNSTQLPHHRFHNKMTGYISNCGGGGVLLAVGPPHLFARNYLFGMNDWDKENVESGKEEQ